MSERPGARCRCLMLAALAWCERRGDPGERDDRRAMQNAAESNESRYPYVLYIL